MKIMIMQMNVYKLKVVYWIALRLGMNGILVTLREKLSKYNSNSAMQGICKRWEYWDGCTDLLHNIEAKYFIYESLDLAPIEDKTSSKIIWMLWLDEFFLLQQVVKHIRRIRKLRTQN